MEKQLFEKFNGDLVTDSMLQDAASLFSENYGVWGEQAAETVGKFAKLGSRVRLSKELLRANYLPDNAKCTYVKVTVNNHLAGNVFSCIWTVDTKRICWVTQLVVDGDYRERGLASALLSQLKEEDIDAYGVMSSHPAACLAAAKAFGHSISTLQFDFMKRNAQVIMEASPIKYVKDANICGSLFTNEESNGLVSSVNTRFFVDHGEPLEALARVQEELDWPLGKLLDGHEFLLIIEARRRFFSRSLSASRRTKV
ncbi:hypothetical protein PVAG01_04394 [Phlyctema vagabunda]|uniref:N-acetyltransferase domain-containing protein n=1 Tax=Phlyctema vagabunda TaxID=108571 RepID=A0ABR4PP52_9HELO